MSPTKTTTKSKPWREVLPVHSEADLYPLMAKTDPAALRELGEDIQKNGLQVPIVILRTVTTSPTARDDRTNYALADGRNRLDAMAAVGIPFKLVWGKGAHNLRPSSSIPSKSGACCAASLCRRADGSSRLVASR
jgi:ParB-like nuclease domain